ncbi:MAG: chemotaxis response regulator protein-glutamate methylesterase [Vicinamibacteria bacterium]|nr:chemotaxis response regulator protein-glutamate methylesterase [Vicinamibacteria bacterium]
MNEPWRPAGAQPLRKNLIHVLVVDDSAVVRRMLTAILERTRRFAVTVASDPIIAMKKMAQKRPDVIVLDLEMPRMDGLTFLRWVREHDPVPVVICSSHVASGSTNALHALREGAVEIVAKPRFGVKGFIEESAMMLTDAIRGAALARHQRPQISTAVLNALSKSEPRAARRSRLNVRDRGVVTLGASTGGVAALTHILEAMPEDVPGIVVVQHMPEGFTRAFADQLDKTCRIHVKEAEDGDDVLTGGALIAPGNRHVVLKRQGRGYRAFLQAGPLVSRHRPSVDVLFHSAAVEAGPDAVGGLLTGMGDDGASGLLEMRRAGAATLAQDEATCVVFGMPREAIMRGAAAAVVSLGGFAKAILDLTVAHARRGGDS